MWELSISFYEWRIFYIILISNIIPFNGVFKSCDTVASNLSLYESRSFKCLSLIFSDISFIITSIDYLFSHKHGNTLISKCDFIFNEYECLVSKGTVVYESNLKHK